MSKYEKKREYRYIVVSKWLKQTKRISKTELAKKLKICRPTLNRDIQLIEKVSMAKFARYGRKIPNNRTSYKLERKIILDTAYQIQEFKKYFGMPFTSTYIDLYELVDHYGISIRCYQDILKRNNIIIDTAKRSTKKVIRQRLRHKVNDSNESLQKIIKGISVPKPFMGKRGYFGDVVEIDACHDYWIPSDEKLHVYHAVDAFTGMLLAIHIEKEETTNGHLQLIRKLLSKWGKPRLIKTDKRMTYWNGEDTSSQLSRILKSIDIDIQVSSSPTFKPNVERSFRNSLNLYRLYIYKNKISGYKGLKNEEENMLVAYNKRYKKMPLSKSSFFPITDYEMKHKVILSTFRKVTNGEVISLNGKILAPFKNTKRIRMIPKTKVKIVEHSGKPYISNNGELFELKEPKGDLINLFEIHKQKQLDFKYMKQRSFNRMLDRKTNKLNSLIMKNAIILDKIQKEKDVSTKHI